jgi:hypothetical protein
MSEISIVIYQLPSEASKWYDINKLSTPMTPLNALANETKFQIESNEATIQRFRTETKQRLEGTPTGNDDLVTICRMIFDILSLQDKINRDRHRISSLAA